MSVQLNDLEKQPLVTTEPANGFSASLGLDGKRNTKILILCSLITIAGGFLMSVFLVQTVRATTPFFVFGSSTPPFLLAFGTIYFVQRKWGHMPPEAHDVRQRDMAILGFFIFLNGLLVLFPNPYVPGMLQALLGPTVMTTPLTMLFSFIFLKRRYDVGRILCAVAILAGSAIAGTASMGETTTSTIPIWVWTILFVASSIPAALSAVFEEHIFHGKNVAPTCVMFWISIWQTMCVLSIGSALDMVPAFGMDAPKDFLSSQRDSFKCLLGDTSVAQYGMQDGELQCQMFCFCGNGRSAVAWFLFVIGFVSQNLGSLGVVKYGSAAFSMIIATVITPLTLFGFCLPFIMGPFGASKLNWQVIVSLITIVFGMVGYTYFDNRIRFRGTK